MKLHNSTYRLVLTALFVALVILFGLTPVGLISLGFINVTLLCIPVIAGTLILGLKTGLLLGRVFWAGEFFEHARRIAYATFLIGGNAVFRQWLSRSADVLCAPAGGSSGGVGRV